MSKGKRLFDVVVAALVLVTASPLLILISALVWRVHGRPILFVQERPGLYTKPFRMYKFRTMTDERDAFGRLLPDAQRLTRLGGILRVTSLDELPELFNVLKGEMSLVGPRPLLMKYLPHYTERERLRHSVRPGVTGLAQISGRNTLAWNERFRLDVWYVENQSFVLDVKILLLTIIRVCRRSGVQLGPSAAVKASFDVERLEEKENRVVKKLIEEGDYK